MIRKPIPQYVTVLLGMASVMVMLGGYTYLSHRQHQVNPDDKTIPSWSQLKEGVGKSLKESKRTGERWLIVDSKATAIRLFAGLFLGVFGAVALGMLMGCFTPLEAFFYPPMALLAKIPPTAMLAVFFVLFGVEQKMYIAMIAFGVLPTLAQSVYLSVKEVPEELPFKAYTLGASHMGGNDGWYNLLKPSSHCKHLVSSAKNWCPARFSQAQPARGRLPPPQLHPCAVKRASQPVASGPGTHFPNDVAAGSNR